MKIGLLNPWKNSAESQLIPAIARAAATLGHTTVECKTSQDILQHQPDFVLSLSRTQPKLTSVPTYGVVFDPRDILLEQTSYLYGLYSYDGVLTIFETLHEFLSDLMFAARREANIGFFYPTSTIVEWTEPVDFASARLAYFGINWDRRRQGLFELLDGRPWMEIYGPEAGWTFLQGSSYKGTVPFDGTSVLERYRSAGVGLCLFSDSHLSDDIVTSRVFEICASGAVVIAPRMPWLERNFGDSILYIEQYTPDDEIARQIDGHMQWIRQHPDDAGDLAGRAQRVFRERFSLDVMLPEVVRYHEAQLQAQRQHDASESVSVIILCTNDSADMLRRSLESIVRQQHRRVEVLLAVDGEDRRAEYEAIIEGYHEHVETCSVVEAPAGSGSGGLWSALTSCSGDLIAVLNSGDAWMPGHLASLMTTLAESDSKGWAFSGSVIQYAHQFHTRGGNLDNRRLNPYPFAVSRDDVVADALAMPISSILFRRAMLDQRALSDPGMSARYEAYVILSLLEREAPAFTYRATAIHYQPEEAAHVGEDPAYARAEARLRLRFVGRAFPPAPRLPDIEALQRAVEQRGETRRQVDDRQVRRRDGVVEYRVPASFEHLAGPEDSWEPVPLTLSPDDLDVSGPTESGPSDARQMASGRTDLSLPLTVEPPRQPWAYGLDWRIRFPEERPYVLRLECRIAGSTAAFGVLGWTRQHFEYRVFVSSQDDRVVVDLPIFQPVDIGGIVVQAAQGGMAVQVTIEAVQLFAATAKFPLAATGRLQEENAQLRATLNTVRQERQSLAEALSVSQRRIKAMRESRAWRLGMVYWRLASRLKTPRG